MITIPTQQKLAAWTQKTEIDGVDYLLDFAWNGRDVAWYINISDIQGNALVCVIKLVTNRPLFKRFHHIVGMPAGELIPFDGSGNIDAAGYSDLNNGVELLYFTAAEVASTRA